MPLSFIDVATSSTSSLVHQSTPHVFCVHLANEKKKRKKEKIMETKERKEKERKKERKKK